MYDNIMKCIWLSKKDILHSTESSYYFVLISSLILLIFYTYQVNNNLSVPGKVAKIGMGLSLTILLNTILGFIIRAYPHSSTVNTLVTAISLMRIIGFIFLLYIIYLSLHMKNNT